MANMNYPTKAHLMVLHGWSTGPQVKESSPKSPDNTTLRIRSWPGGTGINYNHFKQVRKS